MSLNGHYALYCIKCVFRSLPKKFEWRHTHTISGKKCKLRTLVSSNIRFIFAGIPSTGEVSNDSGVVDNGNFQCFLWLVFVALETRPALLYCVTESLVSFSLTPKHVTLNNPEWYFMLNSLFPPVGLELLSLAFTNNCVKQIQMDPHYQRQTCSIGTPVSGNVRFMHTIMGVLW